MLIVSQKLPFALAAGCACVVKPSEMTSASTLHLARLLAEAGLPAGVCNVVTGYGPDVGAPMTSDPRVDMISFTGSTAVGRAAMAAASATLKKVSMELGGKNPQSSFPTPTSRRRSTPALFGAYFNAGECCNGGTRLLLHASIAESFVAELVDRAREVQGRRSARPRNESRRGDQRRPPGQDRGAMSRGAVRRARACALGGARLASNGLFMAPTVVDGVAPTMAIATDEVFGPVVVASDLRLRRRGDRARQPGLLRAVGERVEPRPRHGDRASRARCAPARCGPTRSWTAAPELPFGGFKQSGLGRELGRNAVADYTEEKTFHVHNGPRANWWLARRASA